MRKERREWRGIGEIKGEEEAEEAGSSAEEAEEEEEEAAGVEG